LVSKATNRRAFKIYSRDAQANSISQAVSRLLDVVTQLQDAHPTKRFMLDGRLVGDLGEILVADAYDVQLFNDLRKHHDGMSSDGRRGEGPSGGEPPTMARTSWVAQPSSEQQANGLAPNRLPIFRWISLAS